MALISPVLASASDSVDSHWGYGDVVSEKESQSYVLQLHKPAWEYEPNYNPFGEGLTEELKARYRRDFGLSKAQIGLSQMEYFLQHNQTTGARQEAEAYLAKQRNFADFVVSRYGEKVLDDYMKHNKRLSPVYEVKQRLTTVELSKPEEELKFLFNYNLSGNYMDLKWRHPKYAVDLSVDFIQGEIGPTEAQEYTLRLFRKFFKFDIELYHRYFGKQTDIVYTQQLAQNLQFQWQTNLYLLPEQTSDQDRRTYLGLSYSY